MIEKDQCEENTCREIRQAVAKLEPKLVRAFGETLALLASRVRLPNELIISVVPDLIPWLARFFARIDFGQFTVTTQPFAPRSITLDQFEPHVSWRVDMHRDVGIAIACTLVNIEERAIGQLRM